MADIMKTSETLNYIKKLKIKLMYNMLNLCTKEQQQKFNNIYKSDIPEDLDLAIVQIERTLIKNGTENLIKDFYCG